MQIHESNLSSVPILTPNGSEGGRLYFILGDVGLYERVTEAQNGFLALLEPLEGIDTTPEGKGADARSKALLDDIEKQFAELINRVTGVETAPEAMRKYRPFSAMTDGSFWASAVMAALGKAVSAVELNVKRINRTARKWR